MQDGFGQSHGEELTFRRDAEILERQNGDAARGQLSGRARRLGSRRQTAIARLPPLGIPTVTEEEGTQREDRQRDKSDPSRAT